MLVEPPGNTLAVIVSMPMHPDDDDYKCYFVFWENEILLLGEDNLAACS